MEWLGKSVCCRRGQAQFITIDNKPFYDATAPVRAKYGEKFADLIKRIEAMH